MVLNSKMVLNTISWVGCGDLFRDVSDKMFTFLILKYNIQRGDFEGSFIYRIDNNDPK